MRWVLGEQRARLLRGAKMEEVIFQGSSARRAVNVAEVSLHFSNEDGILPVAFKEVVITRRLSRSGESEYFLNRAPCRLRDIADLLRGTGLGADTGVVIESKMIDALLSDRPDDRRELFEEAAGVGLYRDRRRTTERRLEETTVDLQRLDDLITEVQSQVRSLARQRKRAERHARDHGAPLHDRNRARQARDGGVARRTRAARRPRRASCASAAPRGEQSVRDAEHARDAAHGARAAAEAQRDELLRLVSTQRGPGAADSRRDGGGRRAPAQRARTPAARRAGSERRRGATASAVADGSRAAPCRNASRTSSNSASAIEALTQRQRDEDDARRGRSCAESRARRRRARDRANFRIARAVSRSTASARDARATSSRSASTRWRASAAARRRTYARIDRELESKRWSPPTTRASHAAAAAARRSNTARVSDARSRERESVARAELFRADEAHTSLQGKVNALEALERERVGLAPAAARLLRERDQFGDGAVLGPLSDFIGADQASALLVERFLGATVHAVLVRDRAVAEAVRAWHAAANPGPLLLLPLDALSRRRRPASRRPTRCRTAWTRPAPVATWVRALLGHAHAVDDGAAFIDARGAVWLPGRSAGPGPLRRRAELFALRAELTATERRARRRPQRPTRCASALQDSERSVLRSVGGARGRAASTRVAPPSSRASSSAVASAPSVKSQDADALRERLGRASRSSSLEQARARSTTEVATLGEAARASRPSRRRGA